MSDNLPEKRQLSGLEQIYEKSGADIAKASELEDQLLSEQVESAEQLANKLHISVANAKKILASDDVQEFIQKTFRRAALAELDFIQIKHLKSIIKDKSAKAGVRVRAMKELREVLRTEKEKGPLVTINQNTVAVSFEDFISRLPERK